LESYIYNLRNTLRNLEVAVNETTNWLDASQKASKEKYEDKKAELETLAEYVCLIFVSIFLLLQPYSPLLHLAVFLKALVALVVNPMGFLDAIEDS
jgi:hypothetical protein